MITRELNELTVIGRALDRVRGRKHVILLSEGFDPKMLHGREQLASAESQQDQLSVERGEIWKVDTDNIYGNSAAAADLRTMIESMRRSDVVLHAMDIKGLRSDVDPAEGVKHVSNEALYLLTADTGGQVLKNTNDLTHSFARFLRSQDVTYTLGFRARRDTPGKFHRLRVKVVGVSAARVIHRIGYYEQAPAANQLDQTLSAGDIIMNALPVDDVSFSTFVTPLPQKNAKAEVPVILEIDGRSIVANDAGDVTGAKIFVYVFDSQEVIRDFLHQRITFDLSKVRDKLLGRGVKFYGTLRLDPGDYDVRVLVRAGRSRNGFRSARLYVPSAKEPFVSRPMVFDDVTGWVMVRVPETVQGTYPFQLGETPFVPAAAPLVAGGSIAQLALYTYNMPEDAMQLRAVVKSGAESVNVPLTVSGRTSRDENGAVRLLLKITPPQLAAGQHELVIMVRTADIDTQQVSVPIQTR